jgi:hypothetical protein
LCILQVKEATFMAQVTGATHAIDSETIGYARAHLTGIINDAKAKLAKLDGYSAGIPATTTNGNGPATTAEKPKRKMSVAARKKISERMKARWAGRNKTTAAAPVAPTTAKAKKRGPGRPKKTPARRAADQQSQTEQQ